MSRPNTAEARPRPSTAGARLSSSRAGTKSRPMSAAGTKSRPMSASYSDPAIASMAEIDSAYKARLKKAPSFTIATKQEMVIGGNVPSWTNSIPGPKYQYNADVYKKKAPCITIGTKQEMVIGGNVPSWTNSIPGPGKYKYDTDVVKPRQPVFTMSGGRDCSNGKGDFSPASRKGNEKSGKENDNEAAEPTSAQMEASFNATKPAAPAFSIVTKKEFVVGAGVPSWIKSIPGPIYNYETDCFKKKPPSYTIGKKLPTEGELMSVRSPGPMQYGGAASDAKLQANVDSTKKKSFSTSFGVGPRWQGSTYEMLKSGAGSRYDRPRV